MVHLVGGQGASLGELLRALTRVLFRLLKDLPLPVVRTVNCH